MDNANTSDIDIVITWVDGNDPEWLAQKEKYLPSEAHLDGAQKERYRDWDNIQYIFRGIEKFMPWVRMVHFVTWGHLPKWLNINHPKIHLVNHTDYIPPEYLPTFNSNTIELNLHRISGLAEQFINFNDDMFVIAPTRPEDFFKNGLPCDMAVLSPAPCFRDVMCCVEANNFGIINDYFSMADVSKNKKKWYSLKYGKFLARTIIFSRFHMILGLFEPHIPFSHLKSTMNEVWEKEYAVLDGSCKNKKRTRDDVNEWLFRHWQIMSGNFEPRRWDFGLLLPAERDKEQIISLLKNPGNLKMICINDSKDVKNFEECKRDINAALEHLLPEKSSFEK